MHAKMDRYQHQVSGKNVHLARPPFQGSMTLLHKFRVEEGVCCVNLKFDSTTNISLANMIGELKFMQFKESHRGEVVIFFASLDNHLHIKVDDFIVEPVESS